MSFFGQQNSNQQPASGFGGFGSNSNNNNAGSGTLHIARAPVGIFLSSYSFGVFELLQI